MIQSSYELLWLKELLLHKESVKMDEILRLQPASPKVRLSKGPLVRK